MAAVDGTMMDAAVDNLLVETSIRYGGYGGIAHYLVADTYLVLFSRFVPCGVWEAVYLIDSLLQNQSAAQPEQIHADTQGQSFPVFRLAHVLGIDLQTGHSLLRHVVPQAEQPVEEEPDLTGIPGSRARRAYNRAPSLLVRPRAA
ncbi:hypothetical protein RKD38_002187 [Streptomyces ambofaciens]